MGEYRQKSPLWRATVSNLKDRSSDKHDHQKRLIPLARDRICYSHEYIGMNKKSYDPKYNRPDDGQMTFFT